MVNTVIMWKLSTEQIRPSMSHSSFQFIVTQHLLFIVSFSAAAVQNQHRPLCVHLQLEAFIL